MKHDLQKQILFRRTQWLDPAREEICVLVIAGAAAVSFVILAFSRYIAF